MTVRIGESLEGIDWAQAKADLAADDFDNGRSPRGAAGVVRAIPACRHRLGRRPRGGHGPAALGRRLQRLPSRRVDHVGLPQAGHRRGDGQATDGPRPRPAHRPATDDAEAFYTSLGFRYQPVFMSAIVGEWLVNQANQA